MIYINPYKMIVNLIILILKIFKIIIFNIIQNTIRNDIFKSYEMIKIIFKINL
jgi:hypothetical protein